MKNIPAIWCSRTREILFSRANHDFRQSADKSCFIDGGYEDAYARIGGECLIIHIRPDALLKCILYHDWQFGVTNAKDFPNGFQGRFVITDRSNRMFYKNLIVQDEFGKHFLEQAFPDK